MVIGIDYDEEIESIKRIVMMAGGDRKIERVMIIEHLLNKELCSRGVKDRKFYFFQNQRKRENFWIFVFQRSQLRWYEKMERKLSGSPKSVESIEMERIQSDKSIGTFGFIESWHHIEIGDWHDIKKDMEGTTFWIKKNKLFYPLFIQFPKSTN